MHDALDRCHCRPPETGLLDAIEMEFDCNTTDAYFFFSTPEEKSLATIKYCTGFECNEEESLSTHVNRLLAEDA